MATRVFLARHGATVLSSEDRFAGALDVELSAVGREQARRLGQRLAQEAIAAAYASPLQRAVETARIVAAGHGLDPATVSELRETHHGVFEGRTRAEAQRTYADAYRQWEEDPYTFAPEGGETGLAVLARALPAFLAIVARHPDQSVLVVSHKATIRLLIGHFLGLEPRGYRDKLDQSPCGLNVLDVRPDGRARLALYNDVSHYATLPGPLEKRLSPWWA
jgi:broad specificity phosphatase PhoE